jgi:hypothetical protein
MTNYTWTVTALYTETIHGETDYVVIADYTTIGVDGDYSASLQNTAVFSTDSVSIFVPYEDLTEEIVLTWIKETLGENGVVSIEANIQDLINIQINPPQTPQNTPLPWS